MKLDSDKKKHLRTLGHALKPVVTIGAKGISESVLMEINRALEDHELIKIKLASIEKESRSESIESICTQTKASLIQEIGKVALIYR